MVTRRLGQKDRSESSSTVIWRVDGIIGDRFRLKNNLGKDAMGEVFLVEDLTLGEDRALMAILPQERWNDELAKRFTKEIRVNTNVSDVFRVVRVFECGVDQASGVPYVVMEYLTGPTLRERLQERKTKPTINEALTITSEILKGVDVAHRSGMLYVGLRPEHVKIISESPHLQIKLLDFCVPRELSQDSVTVKLFRKAGTHFYMAPEVQENGLLGWGSDIYSVGAMLYEMLVGAP